MNHEVAEGLTEHVVQPHRTTVDGRCGRCGVAWPCPSVVDLCDVPPDALPRVYTDEAIRALAADGRILDSGRRRGHDHGRPWIVWVLPEYADDDTPPSSTAPRPTIRPPA